MGHPAAAPMTRRDALVCARCTFLKKVELSPFIFFVDEFMAGNMGHQTCTPACTCLAFRKISSRLCLVRIFTSTSENQYCWRAAAARHTRRGRATVLSPARCADFQKVDPLALTPCPFCLQAVLVLPRLLGASWGLLGPPGACLCLLGFAWARFRRHPT